MCWGLVSPVPVLKVMVPKVGYESFSLQEEALGFEFPSNCESLRWGWGLWLGGVSAFPSHLQVIPLLFDQGEGAALPVFRGKSSLCVCRFHCAYGRKTVHGSPRKTHTETKCVYKIYQ